LKHILYLNDLYGSKITGSVVAEGRTRSINVLMMLATLPRIELMIYPHLMQLSFMAKKQKLPSNKKVKSFPLSLVAIHLIFRYPHQYYNGYIFLIQESAAYPGSTHISDWNGIST
jgi:hypothetical protein